MSTILAEFQGTSYFTETIGGTIRWADPELFRIREDGSTPTLTAACDIYSYGSVILQVRICYNQSCLCFNPWYSGTFGSSAVLLPKIGRSHSYGTSQWHSTTTTGSTMDNRDSLALYSAMLDLPRWD